MTTGRLGRALILSCSVSAIAAAPAAAQQCTAPPGTAAIEQYCETVPTAAGGGRPGSGTAAVQPVPPATAKELDAAGASGVRLDDVLRGAPKPAATPPGARPGVPARPARPVRAVPSLEPALPAQPGNPLSAVMASVTGERTVGGGFPWVLLAIAVGVGGTAWVRHALRRGG